MGLGKFIGGIAKLGARSLMPGTSAGLGLIGKTAGSLIHKHAGLIGKVARGIGHKMLGEGTRKVLSSAADTAIKYMPSGQVKDTLSKIKDAAQGRTGAPTEKPIQNKAARQVG